MSVSELLQFPLCSLVFTPFLCFSIPLSAPLCFYVCCVWAWFRSLAPVCSHTCLPSLLPPAVHLLWLIIHSSPDCCSSFVVATHQAMFSSFFLCSNLVFFVLQDHLPLASPSACLAACQLSPANHTTPSFSPWTLPAIVFTPLHLHSPLFLIHLVPATRSVICIWVYLWTLQ